MCATFLSGVFENISNYILGEKRSKSETHKQRMRQGSMISSNKTLTHKLKKKKEFSDYELPVYG